MSDDNGEKHEDELRKTVRDERRRADYFEKLSSRPIAEKLEMAGSIGWLVVIPTLLGILAGRWLDQRYDTNIFWTASLLFVGVVLGSYMAWRRIQYARQSD
jgi:ATP synthase protein I